MGVIELSNDKIKKRATREMGNEIKPRSFMGKGLKY